MLKPLTTALEYAKLGYSVFPCHSILDEQCTCGKPDCKSPGKHPLTANGVKDATVDAEQIKKWWTEHPAANIAIATGKRSGITVLDVDVKSRGMESLEEIEAQLEPLPDTPTVITGGGGRHYYFSFADVSSKANAIPDYPGLDIRSEGGYVIAPYSTHISGRRYEWEAEATLTSVAVAPFPQFLLDLIKNSTPAPGEAFVNVPGVLDGIPEGERDDSLFRYACRLRAKKMNKEEAEVLILEAAARCKPPFTDEEAREKLDSAWNYPAASGLFKELIIDGSATPIVTADDRSVIVEWMAQQVKATAKSLKEHSDGRITGHLAIEATIPGVSHNLRSAQFTFTALRSRTEMAKDLTNKVPEIKWENLIEFLCRTVTDHVQGGEKIQQISADDPRTPVEWAVRPLLLKGHSTVIFGQEGGGKSYLALLLGYLAISNSPVAGKLGFHIKTPLKSLLYLDWEGRADVFRERITLLSNGMMFPPIPIMYRRCARSLFDDLDAIKAGIIDKPDLLIIDSIIPACGGNPNDTQAAGELMAAVHSFNCTTLLLGHAPKGTANTGGATVFGSSIFQFLARSIWEIRTDQEESEDAIRIGLVHKKINYSRREPPMGFTFTFKEDATLVTPASIADLPSMESAQSLTWRITSYLRSQGKSSPIEIAEALDVQQNKVRATLNWLRKQGKVTTFEKGVWAALAQPTEEQY